ncbi:MAG: hypothetical protein CR981_03545 [Proteobacteria bacterium]|nr:MAG: hypothetical protein CR981_03545 [Pseudomonadota bacterium]PIE64344.1 MAG: hypothetical protein CSA26_08870 [Desulfobacterales bacterium]
MQAHHLFDLSSYRHASLFPTSEPVWSALQNLKIYMNTYDYTLKIPPEIKTGSLLADPLVFFEDRLQPAAAFSIDYGDTTKGRLCVKKNGQLCDGASVIMAGAILIGSRIEIGRGTLIEGGATIKAPAILGDQTEVRQGAYLRGYCLVGDRCVVGHCTEVKHTIFLDDAKAGHFAYLGDSILGNNANLGAGTKFANLKFTSENITFTKDSHFFDTGMRKFGAILGDHAQTGCNAVTNPGTILGKRAVLMPNTTALPGYHQDNDLIR